MPTGGRSTGELELMDAHVRALFTHDARSRLLLVNDPWGGGSQAPRLFLGRTAAGHLWRLRADLPDSLAGELESLCAAEPPDAEPRGAPRQADALVRVLETHAPAGVVEAGPAYRFAEYPEPARPLLAVTEENAECLRGGFEELLEELHARPPFLAVVEGGRAVSVCRSVRVTRAAHEAGVETLPEFRGRGYARDATAGWARLVRDGGAVPMYSTSWENAASRAVAKGLRLVQFGADFHVA
jgi:hypothetical protein